MANPAKFNGGNLGGDLGKFTEKANALTDAFNPFKDENKKEGGALPFYQTGARAFIKVGGRALAVCQDFRWQITHQPNPIYTIDTTIPWDIDVGPQSINATLTQIMDPTKGPEVDNLLPIMASAVHQPLVELQILDKLGTSLFFARGMFLSVSGGVTKGQVSTLTAQFTGIAYQNYVAQQFKPYSGIAAGLSGLVNGLGSLASKVSGGIL